MPRIRLLPDPVINQIAAGEVVERPSSAVKELVENSLDAGARTIRVTLAAGGRDLVAVDDDGEGMDHDDLLLAIERHATSKIRTIDDLSVIASLGFRGEALPSIAAASRLVIESAPADAAGHRVEVTFGRLTASGPCTRPRGTRVEAHDLFLRLPARRKFLRTPETELRHAVAILTALAVARPEIAFFLDHGSRTVLRLPAARDLSHRLPDLLGADRARRAAPLAHTAGAVHISGFLLPGASPRDSLVVVNGRPVRDRLLSGTVARGLQTPAGQPLGAAWVIVEVPPRDVDVNVHPAKTEVRFLDPGRVCTAIGAALSQSRPSVEGPVPVRRLVVVPTRPTAPTERTLPFPSAHEPHSEPLAREALPLPYAATTSFGRLIGQYHNTYLIVEDAEGLLLVDQHAAHERILFEQLLARSPTSPTQRLLVPTVIDLTPAQALLAVEEKSALAALGIDIEEASGASIRVLGLPAELGTPDPASLIQSLLDDLTVASPTGATPAERVAASLACHAAIKKNRPLAGREAEQLLRRLAEAKEPHRCPHGRPVMIRLAHSEIEHRIGRR